MTGYTNEDLYAALAYVQNSRASEEGEKKKNENIGRATEKAKEESEVVHADEKKETGGAGFGLDFTVLEELSDVYGIPAHTDFPIQYEERRYCCMKCPSDNDDIQFRTVHMFQLHYKEKHNIDKSSSDVTKQLFLYATTATKPLTITRCSWNTGLCMKKAIAVIVMLFSPRHIHSDDMCPSVL